ncbi:MAG: hypothetical protein ACJAR3_002889 [Roseivirga sp.]|jgi:hypothetical protein
MKVIQSFWTRNSGEILSLKGSWASLESSLSCWALNNELLNRFYDLELYTDSFGYHILVDVLGLKYDKVHFVFDEFEYPFDSRLWCYNKIYVYSIQSSPFLHVDGDVFIWRPFPKYLLQSEVVAQNIEIDLPNYVKCLEEINCTFEHVPKDYFKIVPGERVLASNAGIFGGQDVDVFKELRVTAYDFLSKNLSNIGKVSTGFLNIMSEQLPINKLAEKRNLSISFQLQSRRITLSLTIFIIYMTLRVGCVI